MKNKLQIFGIGLTGVILIIMGSTGCGHVDSTVVTEIPGQHPDTCKATTTTTGVHINCPDGSSGDVANGATGAQGLSGVNGYNALVSTVQSAPSCTNGGITLVTATDSNSNGIIDLGDTNYQSTQVCNGVNGNSGQAGTNGSNGANGGTVTFNLVQAIAPCGFASSPWKEIILGLAGGQLLSSFSESASGQNTRFSFIPNGGYSDTDSSGCSFSVTGDGSTNSQISWGSGSNVYSTWSAGGFNWTPATGWVVQ